MDRKPLVSVNKSRLPGPTPSRLKPPMSIKRKQSSPESIPLDLNASKRRCLDTSNSSVDSNTSVSSISSTKSTRPAVKSKINTSRPPARKSGVAPANARPPTSASIRKAPGQSTVKPVTRAAVTSRPPTARPGVAKPTTTKPAPAKSATGGGKRPGWDLKGRVEDMKKQLEEADEEIYKMKRKLRCAEEEAEDVRRKSNRDLDKLEDTERELSGKRRECVTLQEKIDEMVASHAGIKAEHEVIKCSLERSEERGREKDARIADLQGTIEQQRATIEERNRKMIEHESMRQDLHNTIKGLEGSLEKSQQEGREKDSKIADLEGIIVQLKATIEENNNKIMEHESMRRKLHNTIQELKGNIRVFCRVRPLLGDETLGNGGEIKHLGFPDEDNKVLEMEKVGDANPNESCVNTKRAGGSAYQFNFDRVFQPEDGQAVVFGEISQLVQSALDGYNVCIFAYGQTGSGKTFTMEGAGLENPEARGMIPRTVEQVFETAASLSDKGWQYSFTADFLEIYNETIRDLLGNGKDNTKHEIKMVTSGSLEVNVSDLTYVTVQKEDQVHNLLKKAAENRAVAKTKCNSRSSRSHSIFQLKISGHNEKTGEKSCGLLNLIDLAGSERLKDSGSEGQRLKETQAINQSLANLGNVIMALANKDPHIPYRNSKLTHLLQNSLGGNSKTLMFVNVSPKEECFHETLCSLRFATKVNNCNIGTASKKAK